MNEAIKCIHCGEEHAPMKCPKTVPRGEFEKELRQKFADRKNQTHSIRKVKEEAE